MGKSLKYIMVLMTGLLLFAGQPVYAAGPPAPSAFSNPLAVIMVVLMIILLVIIGILANILLGTADIKLRKKKSKNLQSGITTALVVLGLFIAPSVFAQGATTPATAPAADKLIGGMDSSTFYIMATILFLELFVIIALLINIKFLLKTEKEKISASEPAAEKKPAFNWWDKFNKLRPINEEADIDLGHDYDGIRELDNRLPPWWLYGFYLCIVFAGIYLWRYHVSHTAPLSGEEYSRSVTLGDQRVAQYLKEKGDNVDENTVVVSTDPKDLEAGKAIFTNPANCPTCHGADGSGIVNGNPGVGANLTDNYYIYGGDIKSLFKTIKYGTARGMKSWKDDLSARQMAQVANYVRTLRGTNPPKGKDHEPDAKLYVEEPSKSKAGADSTAKKDSVIK